MDKSRWTCTSRSFQISVGKRTGNIQVSETIVGPLPSSKGEMVRRKQTDVRDKKASTGVEDGKVRGRGRGGDEESSRLLRQQLSL